MAPWRPRPRPCRRLYRCAAVLFAVVLPLRLLPRAVLPAGGLSVLSEWAYDLCRAGTAGSSARAAFGQQQQLLVLLPRSQGLLSIREAMRRRLAEGVSATAVVIP